MNPMVSASPMPNAMDPVTLAVLRGRLEQIADEMDATLYRSAFNPIIAEATRVLGYTNRFGQGLARTNKALELNGNPPAEYKFDAHSFTVALKVRE